MRLIDADALIKWLEEVTDEKDWLVSQYNADWIYSLLECAPTVDAAPIVHGRWEKRKDVFGFVRCSVCRDCNIYDDWPDGKKWNYCPNCGAKMDKNEIM